MMRGVSTWALAVRKPDGSVEATSEPVVSWAKRHRVLRLPVVRGVVALVESLKLGFRAMRIAANSQITEEDEIQEIGGLAWTLTVIGALLLAVGLFFVVPVAATSLFKDQLDSSVLFWIVEGSCGSRSWSATSSPSAGSGRWIAFSSSTARSTRRSRVSRLATS